MKRLIIIISFLSLLISCSKQNPQGMQQMAFSVEMGIEPGWGASTKACPIGNNEDFLKTYTSFGVKVSSGSGVYRDYSKVNYTSGAWTMASPFSWVNNMNLSFYALAPYDFSGNTIITRGDLTGPTGSSKTVSFTYDIKKVDPSGLPDLLFGWYEGTGVLSSGKVSAPLKFYHPLAAIRFKTGTGFVGETVKYVQLSQFGTNATCAVNCSGSAPSFTWGATSKTATYYLNLNQTIASAEEIIGTWDETFIVIPQTLGKKALIVLETSSKRYAVNVTGITLTAGNTSYMTVNDTGIAVSSAGGPTEFISWTEVTAL